MSRGGGEDSTLLRYKCSLLPVRVAAAVYAFTTKQAMAASHSIPTLCSRTPRTLTAFKTSFVMRAHASRSSATLGPFRRCPGQPRVHELAAPPGAKENTTLGEGVLTSPLLPPITITGEVIHAESMSSQFVYPCFLPGFVFGFCIFIRTRYFCSSWLKSCHLAWASFSIF